jgi:hypothetical protein
MIDMGKSYCRDCSGGFDSWEEMRDHQRSGKCPKDRPYLYPPIHSEVIKKEDSKTVTTEKSEKTKTPKTLEDFL